MKRRTALHALTSVALSPFSFAHANASDGQFLNLLVGFSAGSVPDVVARNIGRPLAETLRRTLVVDNKAGVGGQLAMAALKSAPANGLTIGITPMSVMTLYPSSYASLPYDPEKDFAPVCSVCVSDLALVVPASHPAQTLQQFIAWCKENPGKCALGNPGNGSSPHFTGWSFGVAAGLDIQHVAYRSPPQITQELIGGMLTAGIATSSLFNELTKVGRLRVLATTGARRSPLYPQAPTFAELGYPDLVNQEWYMLFAPVRTPRESISEIGDAVSKLATNENILASMAALGFAVDVRGMAWVQEYMRSDIKRWRNVVTRAGFKAQ